MHCVPSFTPNWPCCRREDGPKNEDREKRGWALRFFFPHYYCELPSTFCSRKHSAPSFDLYLMVILFFTRLLNLPDLLLRFNSFLLHLLAKASAAIALTRLHLPLSLFIAHWLGIIVARLLNVTASGCGPAFATPALAQQLMHSLEFWIIISCGSQNKKGFGIAYCWCKEEIFFLGVFGWLIILWGAQFVLTSEENSLPSSSLFFALLLSLAYCPLAALSLSDRPLLASEAFRAPPTPSLPLPSDSSPLLHLQMTCIVCS